MKRSARQFALLLFALCAVSAAVLPGSAGPRPAWGWKPEEAGRPRQPGKAAAKDGWGPAVVTVPAEPAGTAPAPVKEAKAPSPEMPPSVKAYCQNIEDAALDARFLGQKGEILRLEEELAQRTAALESKRAEYQDWLKRRDEFISKAEHGLVELYAKIKPDAAAMQLAAIDEEAAAALLLKLGARTSSAILNQMESGKAARLVSVMIGAARPPEKPPAPEKAAPREASAQQEAGREQALDQQPAAGKKL